MAPQHWQETNAYYDRRRRVVLWIVLLSLLAFIAIIAGFNNGAGKLVAGIAFFIFVVLVCYKLPPWLKRLHRHDDQRD